MPTAPTSYYIPTDILHPFISKHRDKISVKYAYILERIPEKTLAEAGARLYLYMLLIDINGLEILAIDDQITNYSGSGSYTKRILDEIIGYYGAKIVNIGEIPESAYNIILGAVGTTPKIINRSPIELLEYIPLFDVVLIDYPSSKLEKKVFYFYGDGKYWVWFNPKDDDIESIVNLSKKGIMIFHGEHEILYPDFHHVLRSAMIRYQREFPYTWLQ